MDLNKGQWINQPKNFQIGPDSVEIVTEPETDFWQRTYDGVSADNAPALLFEGEPSFTVSARARCDSIPGRCACRRQWSVLRTRC